MSDFIKQAFATDIVRLLLGLCFTAGVLVGMLLGWIAGVRATRG
jgi:hypothetical protein